MRVPFIDFSEQYREIQKEVDEGLKEVFRKSDFILGEEATAFEKSFSGYCGARYGVGVNSGTDALYLAVSSLDIEENDEVLLPAFTFIATALSISYTGAKPVFVDITDDTYNIDPQKMEKIITSRTKAIIPVHLYGQAADMEEILAVARKHNLKVIEDSAQAHGALYGSKHVGSLGDVACFSFYPTKGLGAFGDAGMVVTDNKNVYEKCLMLRDYGRTGRYEHKIKGYNSRLDTIQAVVLEAKLKRLDKWNKMRAGNAAYYCELLKDVDGVTVPVNKKGRSHVYQTFAVRIKEYRDKVYEDLRKQGIGVLIHYPIPLHLQEAYRELGHKPGDFPVSETLAKEIISLPMFPHMTQKQIKEVCDVLKACLAKY